MKRSPLQKLVARFTGKKDNSYQSGGFRLQGVPQQKDSFTSSYGQKKNSVARIKQWLVTRGTAEQSGYRVAPKKNRLWLRLLGVGLCLITVLLFVGFDGPGKIMTSLESIQLFQINSFEITGNSIVANQVIREAADIVVHQTSMLAVSAEKIQEKLAAVPWVASVEVKRNWPSAVEIVVKENIPLALLHKGPSSDPQLYYIDKKGVSFLAVSPGKELDFPVVTGLAEVEDEDIRKQAFAKALLFLNRVRRNDPHLPAQSLSEVHITPGGELIAYLVEYPFPIFFGNVNTRRNYARLIEVLKALYKKERGKELIKEIEYIQMDYLQDKVLVARTGGEE